MNFMRDHKPDQDHPHGKAWDAFWCSLGLIALSIVIAAASYGFLFSVADMRELFQ